MRKIEAWGNWLLCVVMMYAHGQDYTFQDTEDGDGIILNKVTKRWFPVEHVSAMTNEKGENLPKGEDRVLWAINKKIEKAKKKHSGWIRSGMAVRVAPKKDWKPQLFLWSAGKAGHHWL